MDQPQILSICAAMHAHAATCNLSPQERMRLSTIRFTVNPNLTSCAGRAFSATVEISGPIFTKTPIIAQLTDTILHEIAHILAPGDHHGPAWVNVATRIGCGAERCHSMPRARRQSADFIPINPTRL